MLGQRADTATVWLWAGRFCPGEDLRKFRTHTRKPGVRS